MLVWQRRALEHLSYIFPSAHYENREIWREYIPHAARMRDAQESKLDLNLGELCFKAGRCLYVDERTRDALSWLKESFDLRARLSPEDPSSQPIIVAARARWRTPGERAIQGGRKAMC